MEGTHFNMGETVSPIWPLMMVMTSCINSLTEKNQCMLPMMMTMICFDND